MYPEDTGKLHYQVYFRIQNDDQRRFSLVKETGMISFMSGKQQIRLFTVKWLNTWYEQVNVSFWISEWGTQGRCRYSAVSLITRFDFMVPITRVITALQCICRFAHPMFNTNIGHAK